ncbi:hypothetical protein CIHG_10492 [Coccidioides immitis H538.4]|uniref:Uncharacterized protein n=1 Tax=Coccidioides immitis H538.4 TaxID=396776 RepID=A0A0J8S5H7_COCIT|nr:hypothetical protein CIHG_10492 [Coccidioides immitis H538.4]
MKMGPKQYLIREKTHAAQKHCQILKDHQKDIFKTEETDHKIHHNMLKKIQAKHEWYALSTKTSQVQHLIAACRKAQFCQMIVRLEVKIMTHDHNYLAAVSISRERVEEKMRRFLGQLQSLSEDNNSPPAPEKMKKDDFEIVVFSNKNDEKNNETEND